MLTVGPELALLQEGHYSLVVEGGIVAVHPMSCVRHHHLRLTFEAAFEFRRDEEEYRRASLSRHQERRPVQLPQISTVERREGGGGIGHEERSQFRPVLFYQLRSSGLWELIETPFPTHTVHERSHTGLQAALEYLPQWRRLRAFSHWLGGEQRQDGWLAENEAAHQFGMVHCQRERDVRAIGAPHEMKCTGFIGERLV